VSRRALVPPIALLVLAAAVAALAAGALVPPGAAELAAHVHALTAPEMEGRASGTPGGDRAARYLADRLAAMGIAAGGEGGTFFQAFAVGRGARLAAETALDRLGAAPAAFAPGRDFVPHGGSLAGEASGDVVFVGYGIAASGGGDGDYAGVDVRGKVVLALDGGPAQMGDLQPSRLDKLISARRRGAAALLLVGDPLPSLEETAVAVRLVSAAITRAAADALLAPAGQTVSGLVAALSRSRAPISFATGARVRVRVGIEREERRAANVIGVLPGRDPALRAEAVLLGAHYDHLGRAGGVVYPGADDNASGAAVVLGLARAFAAAGGAPRTLVFALFAGEEIGLLGSAHYTRHPALPLDRTAAMLNFDMVGRMKNERLDVSGVASGSGLRAMVTGAASGGGVDLALHDAPFSPSDHASFYAAGVPVLFFHTGGHDDYHAPGDTADKINAAGMAEIARVAARVVERLGGEAQPVYAKLSPPAAGSGMSGAPGGAFLGVSVDGRSEPDGVKLGSVMPGSAAARAGLRDGDVIVRLDDRVLNRFEDLRQALARKRPGDAVSLVYLRDGEDHQTSTMLDARP
jgi:hypothetical protein